jgi:hypothetical protein
VSLEVFTPSHVKYVCDTSEKHVARIPRDPFAAPSLWKAVQDFNMLCVRLGYVEEGKVSRLEWGSAADFFMTD